MNDIPIICFSLAVSYNQPKFHRCASWNPNAITFANSSLVGTNPFAIFIDTMNSIYITASSVNLIQVWINDSLISINGIAYRSYGLFVMSNQEIYVHNGLNGRVEKCSVNAINCTLVMYVKQTCYGLFVDINNSVYCSLTASHQVTRKSVDDSANTSIIIAGTGNVGYEPTMLNFPYGIFVDINFNLYVADTLNNRIQRFQFGHLNGTTMTGQGADGTIQLDRPVDVVLDGDGFLFIVDFGDHRIIGSGPNGFRCLVGCFGMGSTPSQLNHPTTMSFDSHGNLLVVDYINSRIQKFPLVTNSCSKYYISEL